MPDRSISEIDCQAVLFRRIRRASIAPVLSIGTFPMMLVET
jgi:hypothetical protein